MVTSDQSRDFLLAERCCTTSKRWVFCHRDRLSKSKKSSWLVTPTECGSERGPTTQQSTDGWGLTNDNMTGMVCGRRQMLPPFNPRNKSSPLRAIPLKVPAISTRPTTGSSGPRSRPSPLLPANKFHLFRKIRVEIDNDKMR